MSAKGANFALSLRGNEILTPSLLIPNAPHAMLSNLAICTAFLAQEPADNRNMRSTGNTLWSYDTAIAQFALVGGVKVLILNTTKYSPTTGRQMSTLLKAIRESGKKFIIMETVSNLKFGVYYLDVHLKEGEVNKLAKTA